MEAILEWEIDLILWFRQLLPGLVELAEGLTFLGNELFFLLLLPLVYWTLDRRTGARLVILFLISSFVNVTLKWFGEQPRPFDYAPERVVPAMEIPLEEAMERYDATGEGFPSGHTQNAVAVWGYLASQYRRRWAWIVAAVLMVLVPLSRVYLLVHFPHDLLGGYLFGTLVLLAYLWLQPQIEEWLAERGLGWQLGLTFVITALMLFLTPTEGGLTTAGTFLGTGVGLALERHWVGFESSGGWWKAVVRYLGGIVVLVALYAGLKATFSDLEPASVFRVLRYTVMGLWVALVAPYLFKKTRLDGSA